MALTGKTIGELTYLSGATSSTLLIMVNIYIIWNFLSTKIVHYQN
jgi:hypothetical protein